MIRSFGAAIRFDWGLRRGGNAARNRLLELAEGEWLQYLDADDYLLTKKIEQQLSELNDPSSVDVAFSPIILEHWEEQRPLRRETVPIPYDDSWVNLIRWLLPQTGASLWRRTTIADVGGWKIDQPCCQEHELYLRLLGAREVLSLLSHARGRVPPMEFPDGLPQGPLANGLETACNRRRGRVSSEAN